MVEAFMQEKKWEEYYENYEMIENNVNQLQQHLVDNNISIKLHFSAEVFYLSNLFQSNPRIIPTDNQKDETPRTDINLNSLTKFIGAIILVPANAVFAA